MQSRRSRSLPNIGSNQRHDNIPLQNQFSDRQSARRASFGDLSQNTFPPIRSNINAPPQQFRDTYVPQTPPQGIGQSEYESFLSRIPPSFALYQSVADKYRDPVTGRPRAQSAPMRTTHTPQQSTSQPTFELADTRSDLAVGTRTVLPATRQTILTTHLHYIQGEGGSSTISPELPTHPSISSPEIPVSAEPHRYSSETLRRMAKELRTEPPLPDTDQRSLAERLTEKNRNLVQMQIKDRKGRNRRLKGTLQSLGYSYRMEDDIYANPMRVVPPEILSQRPRLAPQPRFQERVDRDDASSTSSSVRSGRERISPIDQNETVFLYSIRQRAKPAANQSDQYLRETHDQRVAKALVRSRKSSYKKDRVERMKRVEKDSKLEKVQFAALGIPVIPEEYEPSEGSEDDSYREYWF